MLNLKKNLAFTMAEVLMVIGIIGVVSALTLPNLNNNVDDRVNVTKAKKVYSDLAAAVDRVSLKYEGTKRDTSNWTAAGTVQRLNSMMKPKGMSTSYWYEAGDCANTATGLADGSSYCVLANNATCLNVLMDVDGTNKGFREVGYDIFKASISIPADYTEPIELKPWSCSDNGTFTTSTQPGSENYLHWIIENDNMDYRKCNTLYYQNVISCK